MSILAVITEKCKWCLGLECTSEDCKLLTQMHKPRQNELQFNGIYHCLVCEIQLSPPYKWICRNSSHFKLTPDQFMEYLSYFHELNIEYYHTPDPEI